ncbi:MAG: ImmA/IrrE family metallo-endopeptidase [SAR202 cluster bacterium]|nr:ImmA/IrrE family metallo-endopeptidase [SAR202 cluster bacterium]
MEESTDHINREMLTVARESRGLTQTEFARAIGVTQGMASKIEVGLIRVSPMLLERISEVLHYPVSFFRNHDPVYGPGVSEFYHRSLKKVSKKLTNKIYALMNIKLTQLSRMLRNIEWDMPRSIPMLDIDDFEGRPEVVARAVRAKWLVPNGPIANMTNLVEDAGGIVVMFDFGTNDVDAISRWLPNMPPVFFVNREIPADRMRFTLAHELGHMVMHRSPNPFMENEANKFAGEFMMPADEIRSSLRSVSLPVLADLKPRWKVSMNALLYRAVDMGLVTANQQRYLWTQMNKAGLRRKEPASLDLPLETPTLLPEIQGYYTGEVGLTLEELAELVSLFPDEAEAEYVTQLRVIASESNEDVSNAVAEAEFIVRNHQRADEDDE